VAEPKPLTDFDSLTDALVGLSSDAGDRAMEYYQSSFTVEHKPDSTPVTEADYAAHEAIVAGLDILTPGVPVLSEEEPDVRFEQRRTWSQYWLVDPLDGTREFIRRNGQFSVNIALIEDHRPVIGVIHVPVSGVTYLAFRNGGAYKQHRGHIPVPIHTHVPLRKPPVVAVSRARRGARLERFLRQVGPHETVAMGSSLKSCLVAEGIADVYASFGPTSEWDTAAAQCVLEEAGGTLTDTDMQPLRYNLRESLVNPSFFASGDPAERWDRFLE
jgi:3'(2'), 5'-bisphosphate nucleotidase